MPAPVLNLDDSPVAIQQQEVFHRLMSGAGTPVFVLGRNEYAERVSRIVAADAFIDDFTKERVYLGRPVIRMTDLPGRCLVISCAIDSLPVTALDRLRAAGALEIIDYFTLSRMAPDRFPPAEFCAGNRQDIIENAARYEWVYSLLADEVSMRHFAKVVRFRLTMDVEHMRGIPLALDRQYFEDFLPLAPGAVFVDGGGFDGQTTLQFTAWKKDYRRVHYFEPSPAMMDASRRNLVGLRDVRLVQKGLFSRNDRMRFNADAGLSSGLSPSGQTEIDVVRLDDEVQEPVTFVKLDVEGAEPGAIQGAADHIRAEAPTMAICIYHDQRDFWRVPSGVLEINKGYKLYVRHYTESIRETVMFFVPKSP
jgi:FkbM family methyltransferase